MYAKELIALYVLLGLAYLSGKVGPVPEWYLMLSLYLGFKWIFDYRKCTLSYLECKLRGVPREMGVLNRFLDDLVDLRQQRWIGVIYAFQALIILNSKTSLSELLDRSF